MTILTIAGRRLMCTILLTSGLSALGCKSSIPGLPPFEIEDATITARPGTPTLTAPTGFSPLGLASDRDGFLYVPASYQPSTPAPLVVLLHGAGSAATFWSSSTEFPQIADESGLVLLAVDSRTTSWDVLFDFQFGVDVKFIDQALAHTFARVNVDPTRIGLAGFSDGASYALSLGVINGDFFTLLAAFSPGRLYGPARRGEPNVYISHGVDDDVLNIGTTRQIVNTMRNAGYVVNYQEFTGGHIVPAEIAREAMGWLVTGTP